MCFRKQDGSSSPSTAAPYFLASIVYKVYTPTYVGSRKLRYFEILLLHTFTLLLWKIFFSFFTDQMPHNVISHERRTHFTLAS